MAVTSDRALLLGAYEIETRRQGFLVGLLLTFALSSIVWTVELELGLAEARLREPIGDPRLVNLLGEILLVAGLLLNVSITHVVSNPRSDPGKKLVSLSASDRGMLFGVSVGIVFFIVGQVIVSQVGAILRSVLFSELIPQIQSWAKWLPSQLTNGYFGKEGNELVRLLREKILDLYNISPHKVPKKILVLMINSFPSPPEQYVKPHRGTFFQAWASLLSLLTVRDVAHEAMAHRELSLFSEALKNLNGMELGWIDFRFREAVQGSASHQTAHGPPPLSWHLTKSQRSAILDAWPQMSPQLDKVRAFLNSGVMPSESPT